MVEPRQRPKRDRGQPRSGIVCVSVCKWLVSSQGSAFLHSKKVDRSLDFRDFLCRNKRWFGFFRLPAQHGEQFQAASAIFFSVGATTSATVLCSSNRQEVLGGTQLSSTAYRLKRVPCENLTCMRSLVVSVGRAATRALPAATEKKRSSARSTRALVWWDERRQRTSSVQFIPSSYSI